MGEGASSLDKTRQSGSGDVIALRPASRGGGVPEGRETEAAAPLDGDDRTADLKEAFDLFGDLSQQLVDSYETLEGRVAELNQELNSVSHQRVEELAEKEQLANRLENLINFLPGGVVVLDSRGTVTECNPAALELLGGPLEGEQWREVIGRAFVPRKDDGHEISLRDGRRISISTRNLGVDGQIILLTDQTETRRLQTELSRHERLSALGKMMSALAHQIRTPLSTAMLYAGHLRNPGLQDGRRVEFAGKLSNRLNHIERQVQDMLLFVKGELPLNDYATVGDLQRGLSEALEVPLNTSKSVCEWANNCDHVPLLCNREALIGALLNLATNSIQAVGEQAELSVEFQQQTLKGQPWLAIVLTDQGPGIDAELLPRVGDLFVTTKSQGTGLGLAVVQAVARAHGGAFDLQSRAGQGTRATLLLPLNQ